MAPLNQSDGNNDTSSEVDAAELTGKTKGGSMAECPVDAFLSRWAMLESGLPIDLDPAMNDTCQPVLGRLYGEAKYNEYK